MAEKDLKNYQYNYVLIMFLFSLIGTIVISICVKFSNPEIPYSNLQVLKHNLESTPIFDILSENNCNNEKTRNILGYYYLYDYEYYNKEQSKRSENADIDYRYFKDIRLCTSSRVNKNYFEYYKYSIDIKEECKEGTKKCGKLNVDRILCINKDEDCPINDIKYSNESNYTYNNIIYKSVKINKTENEYLHYTNESTDNYIITNLTMIDGDGKGFPCGSNDNDNLEKFGKKSKDNAYCTGDYNDFKYYYFKNLSTIEIEYFCNKNEICKYIDYKSGQIMTLFATGYFSINEHDSNNFNGSFYLHTNMKYLKIIQNCYNVCFITIIVIGVATCVILMPAYTQCGDSDSGKLFIHSILIIVYLMIVICCFIEIALKNKAFRKLTSNVPDFLINDYVNKMRRDKSIVAQIHLYICLILIIIQIVIAYPIIKDYLGIDIFSICRKFKYRPLFSKEKDIEITTKITELNPDTSNTPDTSETPEGPETPGF